VQSEIKKNKSTQISNKMKKFPIFLLLAFIVSLSFPKLSTAQKIVFQNNNHKQGIQLLSSNNSSIIIHHSVNEFQLDDVEIEGEIMKKLNFGTEFIPAQAGYPDLRSISRYILIPDDAEIELEIKHKEELVYSNIELAPAAPIPFDTEKQKPAYKGKQYNVDAFYPKKIVESQQTQIRGMHMALISLNPFRYNPVSKELKVYKNLEVEVHIVGGKGTYGEERFRNQYWDPILEDLVFNAQVISKIGYGKRSSRSKDTEGCEYLIIVPDQSEFIQWADSIKLFRTEQGINTQIVTMTEVGGNTVSQIKSFINDVYENWDPVPAAVLLMADYGNDINTITSNSYPHPYEGSYITDNYYADYTGNDLPDFVFARITARNESELETMVHKFMNYERNPPVNSNFYNNPITALGWQTERWFQICSETVGGYMANVLGKDPVRINEVYDGYPNSDPWSTATNTSDVLNYFGPNGLDYIPATPGELGNWSGGDHTDIENALNNGAFILQHRDHGGTYGWGEPSFSTWHIDNLNNVDQLSHIFSINCLTGMFNDSEECFTERFHRYNNGGALSLTAATQVSYSFVNDAFVWGLYDNMWPDFMPDYGGNPIEEREFRPAFGSASGKYFLSTSNWPYNSGSKQITYRLFHHHGDAFGIVYTEVPQDLQLNYAESISSVLDYVEIEANEGAMIAFSVDGELIGTGVGNGNSQQISIDPQLPGTNIKVVVTKQNYFRHEGMISVIPADGPYIIETGYGINDISGNNNQEADMGENIWLDVTVKNLGSEMATNASATISTLDAYVDILNETVEIGNLESDEEVSIADAFQFEIADNIPDGHQIEFEFLATDGSESWESTIQIEVNAPKPDFGTITIDDSSGGDGDGSLEPGESAQVTIEVLNTGNYPSEEGNLLICSLSNDLSIDESSFDVEIIAAQAATEISFSATASEDADYGSLAYIDLEYSAGNYTKDKVWELSLGKIEEDFESGDFSQFDWQFNSEPWYIVGGSQAYEGEYACRSHDITHNEDSYLYLDYSAESAGEISFFYKVSSETNYDYLRFYIDGNLQNSWSGERDWNQASYEISQGDHTFEWKYTKDYSVSNGDDCAWVDMISFPNSAVNQSLLYQNPLQKDVASGEIFTSKIKVANVADMASFDLNLNFDPDLLQVNNIEIKDFLENSGREMQIISQSIDNINGIIDCEITTTGDGIEGVNGSGNLFNIEWEVVASESQSGETSIIFNNVELLNTSEGAISVELLSTNISLGECYQGDVDCDCDVDIVDVTSIAFAYNTVPGDPEYNPLFDMDNDDDIDIVDITMVAFNYGWSCGDKSVAAIETSNSNVLLTLSDEYDDVNEYGYVSILVSNVEELGACEFELEYDSDNIEIIDMLDGDFLIESNRQLLNLASDYSDNDGIINYAITSLGSEIPGATGSGNLLRIKYHKIDNQAAISLTQSKLLRVDGKIIPFKQDQVLSQNGIAQSEVRVFPIPMKDLLNIEYQMNNAGAVIFELKDINGKLIRQWSESHFSSGSFKTVLNRENLVPGVYLLDLKCNNQLWNKTKIIVK